MLQSDRITTPPQAIGFELARRQAAVLRCGFSAQAMRELVSHSGREGRPGPSAPTVKRTRRVAPRAFRSASPPPCPDSAAGRRQGWAIAVRLLPADFARYRARSAACSTEALSAPWRGIKAMPTLPPMLTGLSWSRS